MNCILYLEFYNRRPQRDRGHSTHSCHPGILRVSEFGLLCLYLPKESRRGIFLGIPRKSRSIFLDEFPQKYPRL